MIPFAKALSGLAVAVLTVVLVNAQDKVNFSGTWVVDKSQSDVAQLMGLSDDPGKTRDSSMTMVIEQQGSDLRVTRVMKTQGEERKEIHRYKIGSGQTSNTGFAGETVMGRAFWEGDQLVIVSTRTWRVLMKEISAESRGVWSLSPDGQHLTIAAQVNSPRGEQRGKAVFVKQ
jgi:hypothetical protein